MSDFQIVMPKMGESVEEATIIKWFVSENDTVEEDDLLLEIATDKVDSEIPSPVSGRISKILYKEDDRVPVGEVIAIIDLNGGEAVFGGANEQDVKIKEQPEVKKESNKRANMPPGSGSSAITISASERFYSPLVRNIAKSENISIDELEKIEGSGKNGRVRKDDILNYLDNRKSTENVAVRNSAEHDAGKKGKVSVSIGANDDIIEMDRMRRMIADHMVMSVHTSPHVTSVVEADVTNLVNWRNKIKKEFEEREKQKITFMPIFTEAVAKSLRDFPRVNASVDGTKMILRKEVNIGIAVALPDGNLIVPVVKNADQKNIVGLASDINRLAEAARNNKLSVDDLNGGTFSITNFGTFRNIIGTPIINQPQVAILAVGMIEKKPAVLETASGDVIAIRHKMFLSLSYDHRIVDGALGGAFLRRIADYLEKFDIKRTV